MSRSFRSRLSFGGRKDKTTEQGSNNASVETFPSGLKILYDPPQPTIDVVFLHGLTGDRERTWTHPDTGCCWPRDLLPLSIPSARVLTFGYDAYVVRYRTQVAQIDIAHHANDLLNTLANERRDERCAERPIVFIAHSLGGLLCKDALRIAQNCGERQLQLLSQCVAGIAFVGTPHGGSWIANWAKIPATMLGVVKRSDVTLLSLLKPSSEVLNRIHDEFLAIIRRRALDRPIQVACFYETLPMAGRIQIVEKGSATIPGFNNMSIHADHRDIARHQFASDPGVKNILGVIDRWLQPKTELAYSAEAEEFLQNLAFSEMGVRQAVIESAQPGTCDWILEHPDYKSWRHNAQLDQSHGLLWLKGKPGSGKSTLMKHVVLNTPHAKGVVRLAFFFNARGADEEQTAQGLFRTFLHQLIQESATVRNHLLTHYRIPCVGKRRLLMTRELHLTSSSTQHSFPSAYHQQE